MGLKLDEAQAIVAAAIAYARAKALKPMGFVVLDERGALRAAAVEDGTSLARWKVAFGKAHGALSMGVSSRKLHDMAVERPHFIASLASVFSEGIVPVAGGVLIRDIGGRRDRGRRRVGRHVRQRRGRAHRRHRRGRARDLTRTEPSERRGSTRCCRRGCRPRSNGRVSRHCLWARSSRGRR